MGIDKDAGRPNDDTSDSESLPGTPPETEEGVDRSDGEGRKALSRDDLYARLSAVDDPEEDDEAEEDDLQVEDKEGQPSDEPPAEAEAEEPSDEGEDADDAAAGEDADHNDEEPKKPEEASDEEFFGRVPDDEWSRLPKVTKTRINALKADRKRQIAKAQELEKREPIAKYGEAILTWADRERVSDADMEALLEIGSKFQRGGQAAVEEALRIARHYGWKDSTPSKPASLPDWLQAKVDDMEITEEAAQEVADKLAATGESGDPSQPPPQLTREQEELKMGREALAERQAAAEAKYKGQWAKLWPEVQREMLKHRGAPGSAWGAIFDSALEIVRVREEASNGRKRAPIKDGMGNGQRNAQARPDPDTLTGRKRLLAKYTNARVE